MPDAPSTASSVNHSETPALLLEGAQHADAGPVSAGNDRKPFPEGSPLAGLPMQLDVTIPIPGFRVQDLLALEKGAMLESHWHHGEDVPIWCGGVQLVWSEFEVVGQKLAVRVTRLV